MIAIDNILISDEIITEKFVCDLVRCKGGCCVDGDAGAPLSKDETKEIKKAYKIIKHEMTSEAINEVKKTGTHTTDIEYGYVTPTINGGVCVYAYTEHTGIVKCLFEKAFNEGKLDFKKPISCHLFPIRVTKTDDFEALNYEPRKVLCAPACKQGVSLGVKVFEFLKEPIIRKYGTDFYTMLEQVSKEKF
jgi:hypothetical protein